MLDFILHFIATEGHQPSYQQIADHFKLASKGAVARHIAALEAQGFLTRRLEGGSFSLTISRTDNRRSSVCEIEWAVLPDTVLDIETPDEPLFISIHALGAFQPEKVCAFRVANDAMLDDHICEGDIAIIERRKIAREGEVVLAVVDGCRTVLKKMHRSGGSVEFRPSNPKYDTVSAAADKVLVIGVLRGLVRPLA